MSTSFFKPTHTKCPLHMNFESSMSKHTNVVTSHRVTESQWRTGNVNTCSAAPARAPATRACENGVRVYDTTHTWTCKQEEKFKLCLESSICHRTIAKQHAARNTRTRPTIIQSSHLTHLFTCFFALTHTNIVQAQFAHQFSMATAQLWTSISRVARMLSDFCISPEYKETRRAKNAHRSRIIKASRIITGCFYFHCKVRIYLPLLFLLLLLLIYNYYYRLSFFFSYDTNKLQAGFCEENAY